MSETGLPFAHSELFPPRRAGRSEEGSSPLAPRRSLICTCRGPLRTSLWGKVPTIHCHGHLPSRARSRALAAADLQHPPERGSGWTAPVTLPLLWEELAGQVFRYLDFFKRQVHEANSGISPSVVCACMPNRFGHVELCVTPGTAARQAPLPLGFSRQEDCSCRALLQGIFPTQGSNPGLSRLRALVGRFFTTSAILEASYVAAAAAAAKSLQSCPTVRPHRRRPTRLLCPWTSTEMLHGDDGFLTTDSNLLQRYVRDYTHSAFTKIPYTLTFPPDSLEQPLGAV